MGVTMLEFGGRVPAAGGQGGAVSNAAAIFAAFFLQITHY